VTANSAHQILARAYHEAGHAVVIHQLGYRIHSIWIDSDLSGKTVLDRVGGTPTDTEQITIYEAGGAALELFDPDSIETPEGISASAIAMDQGEIDKIVEQLAPCDDANQGRLRTDAYNRASEIVKKSWHAVELLATRLAACNKILGDEAHAIVKQAPK
jgi:hypothetical protein